LGTRITSAGPKNQLEVYQHTVEQALDQYKQGKIDVTTAHQAHDEAVALLVEALYSHYLIRMRMLRAFRTPRDETFDERTGQ
jgi:hypothetical protein